MREIHPYKTAKGLLKAIDNGGRFYNLLSRADDHVVSKGELAKAAGVFSSGAFDIDERGGLVIQKWFPNLVGVLSTLSSTGEPRRCCTLESTNTHAN